MLARRRHRVGAIALHHQPPQFVVVVAVTDDGHAPDLVDDVWRVVAIRATGNGIVARGGGGGGGGIVARGDGGGGGGGGRGRRRRIHRPPRGTHSSQCFATPRHLDATFVFRVEVG